MTQSMVFVTAIRIDQLQHTAMHDFTTCSSSFYPKKIRQQNTSQNKNFIGYLENVLKIMLSE